MIGRRSTRAVGLFALCLAHMAQAAGAAAHDGAAGDRARRRGIRPRAGRRLRIGAARHRDLERSRRLQHYRRDDPATTAKSRRRSQASRTVLLVDLKTARTLKPRISNGWDADESLSRDDHRATVDRRAHRAARDRTYSADLHRRWHGWDKRVDATSMLGNLAVAGGTVSEDSSRKSWRSRSRWVAQLSRWRVR